MSQGEDGGPAPPKPPPARRPCQGFTVAGPSLRRAPRRRGSRRQRSAQLGDFYARVGREALALDARANADDAANEMAVIMQDGGQGLPPDPPARKRAGAARVRDPRGATLAATASAGRANAETVLARRQGPETRAPTTATLSRRRLACRCDHPLVLADDGSAHRGAAVCGAGTSRAARRCRDEPAARFPLRLQPARRSRASCSARSEDVLATYQAELPLTARQVFYRLVATVQYPKDERGATPPPSASRTSTAGGAPSSSTSAMTA